MKLVDKQYRSSSIDRFPKGVRNDVFSKAVLSSQAGFTLLEMLVVAAILLVVAGGVVTSFRDVGSDAADQAARYQMQQLGEAIEAYYKDNGSIPTRATPADFGFLFIKPASTAVWSVDYRRGWRGPYLNGHKYLYVDMGDDLTADGSSIDTPEDPGEPYVISSSGDEIELVLGIADPYDHYPVDDGQNRSASGCSAADCLLEWRKIEDAAEDPLDRFGRPYLAIDLEVMEDSTIVPGVPRLVSFGNNGIYEPNSCDYTETDPVDAAFCDADLLCSSSGDDIVLCLR